MIKNKLDKLSFYKLDENTFKISVFINKIKKNYIHYKKLEI